MIQNKIEINAAGERVDFYMSVSSPVKMNKRCAEIIYCN
jgi:hypothetical protein